LSDAAGDLLCFPENGDIVVLDLGMFMKLEVTEIDTVSDLPCVIEIEVPLAIELIENITHSQGSDQDLLDRFFRLFFLERK